MIDKMKEKGILFLLIQIDEAHSTEWPVALEPTPEPQKDIKERLERANNFVNNTLNLNPDVFPVCVDIWSNEFAETYHAWPDKYCFAKKLSDNNYEIIKTSEYGSDGENDARIKVDVLELVMKLLD